jgi:hypothetical protein
MIAYRKTNGMAHDLRLVDDNYSPIAGEIVIRGDALPEIDSLHDAAAKRSADIAAVRDEMRRKRDAGLLPRVASIQIDALAAGNNALALEARTLRQNILSITSVDLSGCSTRQEMRAEFARELAKILKPASNGGNLSRDLHDAWNAIDQ